MANISREEDLKDLEERTKYERRLYGRCFPSIDRTVIYNAVHGTNFFDDECLELFLNRGGMEQC